MKQSGYSLVEVLIGIGILSILAKYTLDMAVQTFKKSSYEDVYEYVEGKNKSIAKLILRDQRMLFSNSKEPIVPGDCNQEGLCTSFEIDRVSAKRVQGLFRLSKTQYKTTCKERTGSYREMDKNKAYCLFGINSTCNESGQMSSIEVIAGDYANANGKSLYQSSKINFKLPTNLEKYFIGRAVCVVSGQYDDVIRVVVQSAIVRNPDIQNAMAGDYEVFTEDFLLKQGIDNNLVQRIRR